MQSDRVEPAARAANARFVREHGLAARIAALAEPVIEDLGFRLVRIKVSGRDGATVQIMADKPGGPGGIITIEDCTLISRRLSPLLDADDPLPGGYNLEISSPGIDRPLVRPSDFRDWAGFEARVELKELIGGRKRFRGVIEGFEDGKALLKIELEGAPEPQVAELPAGLIQEAKLVLTGDLVRAALAKGKQAKD